MSVHSGNEAVTHPRNKKRKNKLYADFLIPDEKLILERPRIHALLEKTVQNSVVFVTAGGGYGKTYAVNSFLTQRRKTAFWIPLSERDNDPLHFWESLVKAISIHDPLTGKDLAETGFPESANQISRFISIMAGTASNRKQFILVADNFHLIREKTILNIVNEFLVSPYPKETIILISRREPDLNTMTLLSKGLLSRITVDDLRFNEEEINAYFRLRNISLSRKEAKEIFNDTEGWILAISLIAEEIKNGSPRRGSIRNMIDALFASLPVSYQRFLITISLFDQWPQEVLRKIIDSLPEKLPPMEERIPHLNRLSALYRYDVYLHGFRIHPLFLDYLRKKQKEIPRKEIKTACAITAQWCMENGLLTNAAINYGIAEDYEGLLRAIYSTPRYLSRPAAASFLEILDRVLNANYRNLPPGHEEDKNFLFLRHVTRAGLLLNLGRYDESRAALYKSIREFEALPPNDLSSWILSSCYNTLGTFYILAYHITRDISQAVEYFERGCHYHARFPYVVTGPMAKASIGSYANLTGYPPRKGEFERFIDNMARCIPYASQSVGGYLSGADSLCRAELAYFKGELHAAEQHAREAIFKAREKGQYEIENKSLFYLLRIYIGNGDISANRETWTQMEAQLEIPDYINRYVIYDIITGWIFAHAGETERIAPWLRNEYNESDLALLYYSFETIVKAKCLFAEKRYADALKLLERKEVREGLGSIHLGMLEMTVLEAAIRSRMGDEAGALKTLEAAYMMSDPNFAAGDSAANDSSSRFEMPFIELGEDMRILAGIALSNPAAAGSKSCAIPRSWLETIRNLASVYAKKLTATTEQFCSNLREGEAPFLTSQELSILEGISKGFTREEIAENTNLSLNSVKNIIKTIYDKLGAFNRADAIRIATSQGLL